MYKNKSLERYLNDLAAKMPAPGGGSAAALTAAVGVSLISMVVQFTIGKQKYLRYAKELKKIISQSEKLRSVFLRLADEDVSAYRSKDRKKSLAVPVEVCRLSSEALSLCPPLIKKGNSNLISDVAVAAVLLEAAFVSALYNVKINVSGNKKMLGKKKLCDELKKKCLAVKKIRRETEAGVGKIIRGKTSC